MADEITENQHVDTFLNNGIIARIVSQVDSGAISKKFGKRYSRTGLTRFSNEMAKNIKTLKPGTDYIDQRRKEALEKSKNEQEFYDSFFKKFYLTLNTEGNKTNFSTLSLTVKKKDLPDIALSNLHLRNFFHRLWVNFFSHDNPYIDMIKDNPAPSIRLGIQEGVSEKENMFLWEKKATSPEITATIKITDPVAPSTQEEYLHAAQELSLGSVDGLAVLDKRVSDASKHLIHSSIIIDRIFSSAAAELGPEEFSYWSQKADEVTEEFNKKHLGIKNDPWEKTLLGKEVNKRFQYPIVDYEELGNMILRLTQDVESYIFKPSGQINQSNEALLEILSLQFGTMQYDLMRTLLDFIPTQGKTEADSVELGKQLVEWGKKMLTYYKGKPEEREIVTHHIEYVKPIDKDHYQYKSTHDLIDKMNFEIKRNGIPQPIVSLKTLAEIAWRNAIEAAREITDSSFSIQNPDEVIMPPREVFEKYGIDFLIYNQILNEAKNLYSAYKLIHLRRKSFHKPNKTLLPLHINLINDE